MQWISLWILFCCTRWAQSWCLCVFYECRTLTSLLCIEVASSSFLVYISPVQKRVPAYIDCLHFNLERLKLLPFLLLVVLLLSSPLHGNNSCYMSLFADSWSIGLSGWHDLSCFLVVHKLRGFLGGVSVSFISVCLEMLICLEANKLKSWLAFSIIRCIFWSSSMVKGQSCNGPKMSGVV